MGIVGSVAVAFGALSALGYFSPLTYAPVLLLQLCYQSVWFVGVVLPAVARGSMPAHGWMLAAIFATYIIGDLIALPFPVLFERKRPEAAPVPAA